MLRLLHADLRRKAVWCYESARPAAILKTLLTDGTAAMNYYRLTQWARRCKSMRSESWEARLDDICTHLAALDQPKGVGRRAVL